MKRIREVDSIMHVDIDKFKNFCVENGVCGIDAVEDENILRLPYPVWDHALKVYTFDGKTLIVLNPYGTKKDIECAMSSVDYPYTVQEAGSSFYDSEACLVVVDISTES